jgi:hypothetical protein
MTPATIRWPNRLLSVPKWSEVPDSENLQAGIKRLITYALEGAPKSRRDEKMYYGNPGHE